MVSLASSYFYTSRERPGDNSSYQKYSGKNPLQSYENLIAPVHLPTEEHWLPVMISIIDVCIYIYKSTYFSADIHHTVLKQIYREAKFATRTEHATKWRQLEGKHCFLSEAVKQHGLWRVYL